MRLVLPLVFVLAVALAGCGNGTAPDPTATIPTTEAPAPTDAPSAPADNSTDADGTEQPSEGDGTGQASEGDGDEQADGDADDGDTAAGDTAAGDTAAGDTAAGDTVAGDCSAAGLPTGGDRSTLDEDARATADLLLDAAVRCDEQLLFTAAEESGTSFAFGSATFDDVFGLPEDADEDPAPWEALARLLGGTTPVEADGVWTWPAAFDADAGDEAWQELVDSGLYTQEQVDELRAGSDGYLGWRVGIDNDGAWLFFTAGD